MEIWLNPACSKCRVAVTTQLDEAGDGTTAVGRTDEALAQVISREVP